MIIKRSPTSIEIHIERTALRRTIALVGGLALLVLGGGLSSAETATPSAQPAAPSNLERRVKALEDRVTLNGTYSSNATFCGVTAASFAGNLGGYAGAKTLCENTCGQPTAHMCQIDELVRSKAVGQTLTPGWYATGTVDNFFSSVIDCVGYTDASAPIGPSFSTQFGFSYSSCSTVQPVLCCN